jgi:hypothetical protein
MSVAEEIMGDKQRLSALLFLAQENRHYPTLLLRNFLKNRPMTRTHLKTVAVVTGHDQPTLSKGQQAFNKLIKQIEKKRAQLADWETAIPLYQQKYTSELLPLVNDLMDMQVKVLLSLDRASDHKEMKKSERGMIASLIVNLAGELLAARDDTELKAVYNKHSHSDYDKKEAANIKGMKSMMEDVLGVELGDDFDMSSPEDLLKRVQAQMEEEWAQENAEQEAWEELRPKRKKSAKQLAKEAQQQAEEQQVSLSIREVYRKLVSALHPDREPDAQERKRKTVLMQQVNEAYEKRNLLQLLKLQLELEHIDQTAVNNISEDRLKHYNKILKEQLAELDQEIFHVEGGFMVQFGINPFDRVSPDSIMRDLATKIVSIQHTIRDLKKDVIAFEDIKKVKTWLKKVQREAAKMDDYGDCPF